MYIVSYGLFVPVSIMLLIVAFNTGVRTSILANRTVSRIEKQLSQADKWYWLFFILCMAIGFFVRIYRFCELPKGTNQDGARAAYESFLLLNDGVDSFGRSWPTYFEAWRYTNMSTLYSWIMIPFIRLFGNTLLAMRLPSLMLSLLMLPLLWDLGRRIKGKSFGLLVLFLVVTNPWQIIQSRWGIESNYAPHFFLLGFYLLYIGLDKRFFLYLSMIIFGLTVYAYGLASILVPAFLLPAAIYLVSRKKVSLMELICCILIFGLVSGMYYWTMVINAFGLETVHIGPFTLPYLELSNRSSEIAFAQKDGIFAMSQNVREVFQMLFVCNTENAPYDAIDWAHAMYRFMPVFYVFGFVWLWKKRREDVRCDRDTDFRTCSILMMSYVMASVFTGLQVGVNIIRINSLFYILILLSAYAIYEMASRVHLTAVIAVMMIFLSFVTLSVDYFTNKSYQDYVGLYFRSGLFKALKDTWDWDYDQYVIGVASGTERTIVEPTVQYAHEIGYEAKNDEKELIGADGEPTDWYYTERYQFITNSEEYEPDPMDCNVYVMVKDLYLSRFDEEDYLIYDYDQYIVAYPRYWAED